MHFIRQIDANKSILFPCHGASIASKTLRTWFEQRHQSQTYLVSDTVAHGVVSCCDSASLWSNWVSASFRNRGSCCLQLLKSESKKRSTLKRDNSTQNQRYIFFALPIETVIYIDCFGATCRVLEISKKVFPAGNCVQQVMSSHDF